MRHLAFALVINEDRLVIAFGLREARTVLASPLMAKA